MNQSHDSSKPDSPQPDSTNPPDTSIATRIRNLLSVLGSVLHTIPENFLLIGISSSVGIVIGIGGTAGRIFQLAPNPGQQTPAPDSGSLIPINMNEVCQDPKYYDLKKGTNYKNIKPGEATQLSDNKEKIWPVDRWRCQYQESGDHNIKVAGLNLDLFCQKISPNKKSYAAYLHYNDAKSWYCVNHSQP